MSRATDLAWAAGFLEGEGTFIRYKNSYSHLVAASQANREPLERLVRILGGRIYEHQSWAQEWTYKKKYWCWRTTGDKARHLMRLLRPRLSTRRQAQIRTALARRREQAQHKTHRRG